jgi:nucleotide-binding universal stress UspA family protein
MITESKKLLFVTNFDEMRFDALQSFLDLRKADYNHIVLLTVIEKDKVSMRRGTGYQKQEAIKLKEKANIRFIDWAENLFEQGMEVGVYISVGDFVQQLSESSKKEKVDLIVIGRIKKTKFEQLYSGYDLTELIKRTSAPLLIYKHIIRDKNVINKPFYNPLFAMDWSPACEKAIEYIKSLNKVIKKIDIIHVASEKELEGTAMSVQKTRKEAMKKLEKACEILEAEGIEAIPHVYVGDTVSEIETAAKECRSSMIIVGASSASAWKERLIGSKPKKLVEKSEYPILLIPSLLE